MEPTEPPAPRRQPRRHPVRRLRGKVGRGDPPRRECGVKVVWQPDDHINFLWRRAARGGRTPAGRRGEAAEECGGRVLLITTAGHPIAQPYVNLSLSARDCALDGGPDPLLHLARAIETAVEDIARVPLDDTAIIGYIYVEDENRVYSTLGEAHRGYPDDFPHAPEAWWRQLTVPGARTRLAGLALASAAAGATLGSALNQALFG
jgi:hypothetical protein